jgi:hypothetical protein
MSRVDCRSRVLTLDGTQYSITERKDGVGYVRTHLPTRAGYPTDTPPLF